jgi:hypothetical protein
MNPSPHDGNTQPVTQPSVSTRLPSSHCSPVSTMPSPQNGNKHVSRH